MVTNDTTKIEETNDWLVELFTLGSYYRVTGNEALGNFIDTFDRTTQAKKKTCPRCNGAGRLSHFSHIKAGECFACHGTGTK